MHPKGEIMGMYTELYMGVELSKNTPVELIEWLDGHTGDDVDYDLLDKICPEELRGTRLSILSGSSYYFDAMPHFCFKYDNISQSYFLTFGCNIKNYSNEVDTLLKILEPFITSDGHIGHIRYEEYDVPTLLFMKDGLIVKDNK